MLSPHHDGSSLYVDDPNPSLGETVNVRLRVPADAGPCGKVWVRVVADGEPHFVEATVDERTDSDVWYRARVEARNPVTPYRWITDTHGWVNQEGRTAYDPSDHSDFRIVTHAAPPSWVRQGAFYEIFPDRFSRSQRADDRPQPDWAVRRDWAVGPSPEWPAAMADFYGGDLDGALERIGHLQSLNIGGVWTTPFFPSRSNHRYDAASFDFVDPLLGGDDALQRLIAGLHAVEIRLIGDLTTNHTGSSHEWFRRAVADASSMEAAMYSFIDHPHTYETFPGARTLPKLDHRSEDLRRRFYEGAGSIVAKYCTAPFHLDGWRIDVAQMTGRLKETDATHRVAHTVRQTMTEANPDAFLVAEHAHDASADLDRDGWHATMNYAGFTNPLARWLAGPEGVGGFGMPFSLPAVDGHATARTLTHHASLVSWRTRTHHLNQLTTHDTPRFRSRVGAARHRMAVGMMATFPGVPLVFQGDEFGMEADHEHLTRSPIPWDQPERWDHVTLETYRVLLRIRAMWPVLQTGGFRWVSVGADYLAWLREDGRHSMLCVAVRGSSARFALPASLPAEWSKLFGPGSLARHGDKTMCSVDGPSFSLWVHETGA
jgi:alpha-glucosidase